ncbi:MAG: PBP1A family penicillin-binding protein [Lachnospiraceae bacterium]|nr:PBP1A family penicillin-binding protein [Lachnospiraceae bacterium]
MNYGRKGVRNRQKQLNAHPGRWGKKITLFVFELFLAAAVSVGIIAAAAGFGIFNGIIATAPDMENLDVSPSGFSTFVYDIEGRQTAKLVSSDSNRIPVSMSQIPENMAHAFVAIEDERFYDHNGIDIQGIFRAGWIGVTSRHFSQGASTITQQLIKNNVLTSWTSEEKFAEKLKRKVQEQYLALELEKIMDKDKILENYMNTINLGQNTLGVQAASLRYFNKDVSQLTLSECAVIAAITQNPSGNNPIRHPDKNKERRDKTLKNMLEQGYISQAEYDEAMADDPYSRIQIVNLEVEDDTINSYFVDALVDDVMEDLINAGYTENQAFYMLYSGGLKIYSTQDPAIQKICDEAFTNEENFPSDTKWELAYELTIEHSNGELENYNAHKMLKWYQETVKSSYTLLYSSMEDAQADIDFYKEAIMQEGDEVYGENITLTPQPQVSIVIQDQNTGHVVAMVGGRGQKTASRTLNRATDATRQPGSTFKILSTYLPALDSAGLTLADVHMDEPYNYENGRPVKNADNKFRGICSFRYAIQQSVNVIAVKTLTQITPQLGFDYLQSLGFTTLETSKIVGNEVFSDIQQSLALGGITNGVTNEELTAGYASIANGGIYNEPILYTKITDHDGNIILDKTATQQTRRVMKETTSFLLTSAMQDVVTSGTGASVNFGNMSIAGKTGTTTGPVDRWFCGYTPYYTASVWVGYDNTLTTTNLSKTEQSLATSLWRIVMSQIHQELPNTSFPTPTGLVTATVCSQSGKLPVSGLCDGTLRTEYFAEGTVPTTSCNVHYSGAVCAYSVLTGAVPASPECPYKVPGVLTLNPDTLTPTTEDGTMEETGTEEGQGTIEDPAALQQQTPGVTCQHNAMFFATPGYEALLQQQSAEMAAAGIGYGMPEEQPTEGSAITPPPEEAGQPEAVEE